MVTRPERKRKKRDRRLGGGQNRVERVSGHRLTKNQTGREKEGKKEIEEGKTRYR